MQVEKVKRYEGDIEPKTQFRHGRGTYNYDNSFFKYDGEWRENVKHGQGRFEMKDGSYYEGEFFQGEITGHGAMHWANGSSYTGSFMNGTKHGVGEFTSKDGGVYSGEWKNNLRDGRGQLTKTDGTVIEGEFRQHKPNGKIKLEGADGIRFEGDVINGVKDGRGVWKNTVDEIEYDGEWMNDKKHGEGKVDYKKIGYNYDGKFVDDKPEYIASVLTIDRPKHETEENEEAKQEVAAKPAKGSKVDSKAAESTKNTLKCNIGGIPLIFEARVCYQGPDYEDPVQPTKEEIEEKIKQAEKERKKTKNAPALNTEEFYKPRMITPSPMTVTAESGRKLEISLYQKIEEKDKPATYRKYRIDYREAIANRRTEIQQQKEQLEKLIAEYQEAAVAKPTKESRAKKTGKKDAKAEPSPLEQTVDERILLYNEEDPEEQKSMLAYSETGVCTVGGLEFPEDFPPGNYKICIKDVTEIVDLPKLVDGESDLIIYPGEGVVDDKKKKKK